MDKYKLRLEKLVELLENVDTSAQEFTNVNDYLVFLYEAKREEEIQVAQDSFDRAHVPAYKPPNYGGITIPISPTPPWTVTNTVHDGHSMESSIPPLPPYSERDEYWDTRSGGSH